MTQHGQVLGAIALTNPSVILSKGNIQHLMDFVINAPVLSHNSTKLGRLVYCPRDIERLVLKPKQLGEVMPVGEKNGQAVLSPNMSWRLIFRFGRDHG